MNDSVPLPFETPRQAALFALLLVTLLLLPFLVGGRHWSAVPVNDGAFSYVQRTMDDTSDLDVLFVASSYLWVGVDPLVVEHALTAKLGRKASVAMLGTNTRGEELMHLLIKDVLSRRKVGAVV